MTTDMQSLQTLRDWVRWGCSRFNEAGLCFGHGTNNAWDEALALALYALHLPHEVSSDCLDARLMEYEKKAINVLFARRIEERLPLPYLTQHIQFAGLEFYVDPRVLIPRSPIAELIEKKFSPWIDEDDVTNILDLCTGSGCIAIACAMYFHDAYVDATDISPDALMVAQRNIERYRLQDVVTLILSDLFTAVPIKRYDVIVSNPPYVSPQEFDVLPTEYNHEPTQALLAEDDGLAVVIQILQQANHYLSEHGILVVEVGNAQEALIERFPEVEFMWLEFARGGQGVFLLTAEQLNDYQELFHER